MSEEKISEREIAKAILEEILVDDDIGERAKIWILAKIEQYAWQQYQYRKRKREYIAYIASIAKTKAIQQKKDWLLQDLQRTRESILRQAKEKGKVVVRAGTKDNPTRQEAAMYISPFRFSPLFDETTEGEQVWSAQMPTVEIQKPLLL